MMYSGGLVEASSAEGEEYGDDKRTALLHDHADETPAQLRESVISSLTSFASATDAQDDLTFAILKF
jgi:serine phosphatase RsbU (regulator of sigma subunit)